MTKEIVKDKIKVFVSSRCGSPKYIRYDQVRKELQRKIEQTGLAEVYLFEDGLASTQTAEQDYLYELDDSDVCVFLIDNADGVTPAILSEINRAKSQSKKSIYLFCDEAQQEPTQIQNELVGAKGSRYYVVNSFDDFITIGYESLINDINKIYRHYCKNRLVDNEFSDYIETKLEDETQSIETLGKRVLKGLDKSRYFISRQILNTKVDIQNTNELDGYCEDFLHVLFGERSIREFNTSLLLEYLQNEQSANLYKVVECRWKAIQSYWQGDLQKCIFHLEKALRKAKACLLPQWLVQDILIDLRNMTRRHGDEKNKFILRSDAQIQLDKMEESLYYPILDRYTNGLYEEINKQRVKHKTKSPYSVNLGNYIDNFADNIANIFVIAIFNGSLTHILLTLERVKSVAFHLCEKYSDWQFRVLLLKITIYRGNKKEVDQFIKTFNDVLGKMNSTDAKEIYDFCKTNPIKYQRTIAMMNAFSHLGYYFSDEDYDNIQEVLLNLIEGWLNDEQRIIAKGNHIMNLLKNNRLRMDHNKIAEICLGVISKGMGRYYNDVFKLLSYIGLKNVNNELSTQIILQINRILMRNEFSKYHNLLSAIITIRVTKTELSNDLHQAAIDYLPEASRDEYMLEVMTESQEESIEHIQKYIDVIKKRNLTQGKKGVFAGYGTNPYQVISNIIKYNNVNLSEGLGQNIVEAAIDTLINTRQFISDKISAMQLIVYVQKYFGKKTPVSLYYQKLRDQEEIVKNGQDSILDNYSITTLHINYLMLKVVFEDADYNTFFDVFGRYGMLNTFERLEALKAINNLLDDGYCKRIDKNILFIFLQFILSMCSDENHDVRYYSAKALNVMLTDDTERPILTQLSRFMDFDSVYIKTSIISHFDRFKTVNPNITSLMIQKASVDNHFVVRELGKEHLKKL